MDRRSGSATFPPLHYRLYRCHEAAGAPYGTRTRTSAEGFLGGIGVGGGRGEGLHGWQDGESDCECAEEIACRHLRTSRYCSSSQCIQTVCRCRFSSPVYGSLREQRGAT